MKMFGWKCKECGYGDYSIKTQDTDVKPEDHMQKAGHGKWNYTSYGIKHPGQISEKLADKLHTKV